MYVAVIPNRGSPPTYLLRESYRENGKVKNRTLANISHLPLGQIRLLSRVLKGERLLPADEALRITRSTPHGHVRAVLAMCAFLRLPELLASRRSRQRDLALAMIVQRVLDPGSKLATTRLWKNNTLGEELEVADAEVDELYDALDWLLRRQTRIENKLARRHLHQGDLVHYDVSSSSYTGATCVLARFGHNRDGKKLPCIVYGVMTDGQGRPVSVDVYPGNTADPATVPDQMEKLKTRFRLERVVAVGDRGMLTQTQIETLQRRPGLGWLSALRSRSIRKLVDHGQIERSLFDERNLAEIRSPDFPGERLIACYNPLLAERRVKKREALLRATEAALGRIGREVARRTKTPLKKDQIDRETGLDGIYVIRTSEPAEILPADQAVRGYKRLADVERAFRSLKSLELLVRPIHHRLENRVKAHIFVCLLAYYVQWHLKQAWAPLLFADEQLEQHRAARDPVASAQPAAELAQKKTTRQTPAGHELQSFRTLIDELATQCRNRCRLGPESSAVELTTHTDPTPLQTEAFHLLDTYCSQPL